jgi:TolB-like protein/Tfp pilus assembly protein PilF
MAILLILSAVLAWTSRDQLVLAPGHVESMARVADPSLPSQVYFGPPNSVAVLPFNCRRFPAAVESGANGEERHDVRAAPDGTDPVIAFGMAETVIDELVRIRGLQVTAPVSSFFFADSTEPPPVLAERLKVRHLLDGCVSRNADSLQVDAGLYDVRARSVSWSRRFDVPLPDVFGVIDQLTSGSAAEIREGAGGDARPTGTFPIAAWLQWAAGRWYARQSSPGSLEGAGLAYEKALEIEPDMANAWLGLAELYLLPAWKSPDDLPGFEHAREAARKALGRDPGLAPAHVVLSRISRVHDWDFGRAHEEGRQALDLLPGDADVLENAGAIEFIFGRFKSAINYLDRAIDRNPVVLNKLLRLGLANEFAGEYDQALVVYRQLLGLNPDYPGAYAFRARVKLNQGKAESALTEAELETQPFWRRYALILALDALDRFTESDPLLEALIREDSHDAAFQIAEIHSMRGDFDAAFEWLERAREQHDGGMSEILGNPFLAALHSDDRWPGLVDRMGLRPSGGAGRDRLRRDGNTDH